METVTLQRAISRGRVNGRKGKDRKRQQLIQRIKYG
jgi:hypothetical protein